jgi:magnesium chelatase family protein
VTALRSAAAIARVRTFAFSGIEAVPVEVQVQISSGTPALLLVGLPDKAVGEARERMRAALSAMGLALPPRRVLINLAPADLLKEGSHFDLPITLGVLAAMEVVPREDLYGYAALGELSLDGTLNPVAGVLPAAIGASTLDLGLICPASQGGEAAWAGRIEVLAATDLLSLINHFRGTQVLTPPETAGVAEAVRSPDLADVKGMETAKRAIEIAAGGGHNLLMIGPPGSGKSMLAARMPGLLPDLTPKEALEVSMIHSVAGMLEGGRLVMRPPFREPHHSASQAALAGGGQRARPGEISLAHRGVLFLDELPEFPKQTLESLRQPMETGRTTVARAAAHITYLGDASRECGRAPRCAEDYQNRLSGPMLDRIDLTVEVQPATAAELARAPPGEPSASVAARVAQARAAQRKRYGEDGPTSNAEADSRDVEMTTDSHALAEQAMEKLRLSPRGYTRVLRVGRTIADLAGAKVVQRPHVAEALAFRHRMPGRKW